MTEELSLEQKLRKPGARGEPVLLADGHAWLVPTLSAAFRFESGCVVAAPPAVGERLLANLDRLIALSPRDPEELLTQGACAACCFETAYEALAVNYDLTPDAAESILNVHVLPDVLAVLLGKKKRRAAPGGDT